jgi:hypothetical protein
LAVPDRFTGGVAPARSASTIHAESKQLSLIGFESDLHRLATNLAILDVRLAAGGQIDDDVHRLRANGQ